MYTCKQCGNNKVFNELKNVQTIVIQAKNSRFLSVDEVLSIVEVFCGNCKASTEDGDILGIDGKPVVLDKEG